VAFVRELISQARRNVADTPRFEWRLATAKAGLVCAPTNRADCDLRFWIGVIRRTVQLEQECKVMRKNDNLSACRFGDQAFRDGLSVHVV
ncbi:hypothetical protein, partial [Acinetobacter baumannii]|uniref:hypothetical protein n=1 Tax=Acinetobacter baumannii TaxID=470 RepID=UPI001C097BAD